MDRLKLVLVNKEQKNTVEHSYSSKKYEYTSTKYITHTSPVAINVYQDKTFIIIFGKTITSILITSENVAKSFKEYFDLLWN